MFQVLELGKLGYQEAWDRQVDIAKEVAGGGPDTLVFVEHPPVLTLGASFHPENLLVSREELEAMEILVSKSDRGGDVTFHGPGQLVAYPIFDLNRHGKDLHLWLRNLEQAVITALNSFGVEGRRFPPHTGVWVNDKKVAAIGIKVTRWVSIHGIAINCNNDLSPFELIVPCGIQGYSVTSLTNELGREITIHDAQNALAESFREVFTEGG
ncbi:MAG: lipoyl(octanoyl) transferase LipB [Fimbriimonadaceae bacterium]